MAYTWKQAQVLVNRELDMQARLAGNPSQGQALHVPCLFGPPGIGKTELIEEAAMRRDMTLSVLNGGEIGDPTDFTGIALPPSLMSFSQDGGKKDLSLAWYLSEQILRACRQPTFLLIDDFDKAPPQLQGIFLALTSARLIRDVQLHPGTLVAFAGNRIEDDALSNEISASLRTRTTPIEMEANLKDFADYAEATGHIHPAIIGFLHWKPDSLYLPLEDSYRFPTPRTWKEVSQDFAAYPSPHEIIFKGADPNWKLLVGLKCGAPTAASFWAWYEIIQQVDIEAILVRGEFDLPKSSNTNPNMSFYAAIYAVALTLNMDVKSKYKGLEAFVRMMPSELRAALLAQLHDKTRGRLKSMMPATMETLMESVI